MEILGTVKDLENMNITDDILRDKLNEYLSAIEANYGYSRNIFEDDGGLALLINSEEDIYEADNYICLDNDDYEYIEPLGDDYILMLKLCNNEFSILAIIRKSVCPSHLLKATEGY